MTKQIDCSEIILFKNTNYSICRDPGMEHGRHENAPFSTATTTLSKTKNERIYH